MPLTTQLLVLDWKWPQKAEACRCNTYINYAEYMEC